MTPHSPKSEVTHTTSQGEQISLINTALPRSNEKTMRKTPSEEEGLDRAQAKEDLLQRARLIMGEHRYVHFSLQDGRAVHLSRIDEGIIVHAVNPGVFPNEVRYTNIEERTFIESSHGKIETKEISQDVLERTDVILNDLEIFLFERAQRPLLVQVSPQGYHENDISKLKLGLPDTGGQDKYINDSGNALTELGYTVLNVNRAGPIHPNNQDVREGMHYSHTGMDLLFVADELQAEDDRYGQFIPKEQMYPEEEWIDGAPPSDKIFFGMARKLFQHLMSEPQCREFILIGHYADGGIVAWHTARLVETAIERTPSLSELGYKVPQVWYNAHSLGVLKQRALESAGERYEPEELRFEVRHRFEQFLYDNVDGVISTSDTMTRTMEGDFQREIDYFLPPGVDTNQFHPRAKGVSRADTRYEDAWKILTETSGHPKEVLNDAILVMEISRTAETKGKIDVIRAFAASLTEEDMLSDGKFLIINIADPERRGIQKAERRLAESLHKEIEDLGIGRWVITRNDFAPTMVAKLHQMADIFITGAVSEPWGMSLQQAAASRQAVISTTRVPAATSVLRGDSPAKLLSEDGMRLFDVGEGALFIEPNDVSSGAEAIRYLSENREAASALAARAVELVVPKYTWPTMVSQFVMDAFNHDIDGTGKVVWPKAKAFLERLTEPRWA